MRQAGVEVACIAEAVAAALRWAGIHDGVVAVLVTDDVQMQAFNRDYRGVDAPTDVLSFAQHDGSTAERQALPPELAQALEQQLGDLVIALPYTPTPGATLRHNPGLRVASVVRARHIASARLRSCHAGRKSGHVGGAERNSGELGEEPHIDREYD